ncbi:MAG: hypothetical protein AAF548_02505 [Actinomycetota bacterium]
MRKLWVMMAALGMLGAACSSEADTETVAVPRQLPPVDTGDVARGDDAPGDDVVPDDDVGGGDLATSAPGSEFDFALSGDACNDALRLIIGPEAEALNDVELDVIQPIVRNVLGQFDEAAADTFDRLLDITPDASNEEVHAIVTAMDTVTIEPCGWPFYGALAAVGDATAVKFCTVSAAIDGPEPPEQTSEMDCDDEEIVAPNVLPCFEAKDVDLANVWDITDPWTPVDCATGNEVYWDHTEGAWIEGEQRSPEETFQAVDEAIG